MHYLHQIQLFNYFFPFFFFRKTSEDQGHCHSQSRNQRKRLEHIEAILEKLSRHSATKFDPQEMLACGYLRLSKHNIETLESMIKDSGQDPGIHAHSDVREYDLWADIKRENELEEAAAHAPSVSPTKKIKGWSVGCDYAEVYDENHYCTSLPKSLYSHYVFFLW